MRQEEKNWPSSGNNKTCNFWIKKFTSFHVMLCRARNELIQRDAEFPTWPPGPRTVMIKKQENLALKTTDRLHASIISTR